LLLYVIGDGELKKDVVKFAKQNLLSKQREIRKKRKLYYRKLAILSREIKRKEAVLRYTFLKQAILRGCNTVLHIERFATKDLIFPNPCQQTLKLYSMYSVKRVFFILH
jgi:hypothetical protein